MTKLKDFSDEFDVPYLREDNPWISRLQCSQAVEHSSRGNLVKSEFYRAFEAAVRKQLNWHRGWGFSCESIESCCLG